MSFMQEVLKQNKSIWDECSSIPFVQELQSGLLPFEKFKEYMIQDSIYLKHYARIYGKAIYHSEKLRDIQIYYSILNFVTDTESAVRLNYLKQFDITDDDIEFIEPLPETTKYIDFMLDIAERGNIPEILMAVLPCMLSYSYIFRKIAPNSTQSKYYDFISDYAEDEYAQSCRQWCDFADEKCKGLNEQELKKLSDIFQTASYLELDFWKMAYREECL